MQKRAWNRLCSVKAPPECFFDSRLSILVKLRQVSPTDSHVVVREQLPQIFKGSYIHDLNLTFGNPTYREERIVTVTHSRFGPCFFLCAAERTDHVKLSVNPTINCDPARDKLKITVNLGDLSSCLKSLKLELVQTVTLNSWKEGKIRDKTSVENVALTRVVRELAVDKDGLTLLHELSFAENLGQGKLSAS